MDAFFVATFGRRFGYACRLNRDTHRVSNADEVIDQFDFRFVQCELVVVGRNDVTHRVKRVVRFGCGVVTGHGNFGCQ